MKRYLRFLLNLVRTVIFNYRVLPLKTAIKLPFWLNQKVEINGNTGDVIFSVPVKRKMFVFSAIHSEVLGKKPFQWKNHGQIVINGENIRIGTGTCIIALEGATLRFNSNVTLGGVNKIISQESISLGSNLRTAWEVQIIDTNFHFTIDSKSQKVVAKQDKIIIENNCWLANRASLMKGTCLPVGTVVASNSIVNKKFYIPKDENSIVVGGSPAKIIGKNITRLRLTGKQEIELTKRIKSSQENFLIIDDINKLEMDWL